MPSHEKPVLHSALQVGAVRSQANKSGTRKLNYCPNCVFATTHTKQEMLRGIDTSSLAWKAAAISGAAAVTLGAFGAHALQRRVTDPRMLDVWKTASQYHLLHSVALIGAAAHPSTLPAAFFIGGITLFSGSLYAMVVTDQRWLGAITPIGGASFIAGWLALLLKK